MRETPQRNLALFLDFENIVRSVRQRHVEERVDLRAILGELEAKGRILVKRAYADWGYFKDYRSDLLQHGIEPVQVFAASREREGWKNGADIRIAIDAIEIAYRFPDITDFVLVSGDSDFLSLVTRLRENGKTVWGIGLKWSSSQYLVHSCDHYLFYEEMVELVADDGGGDEAAPAQGVRRDARTLLLTALRRMTDRQGLPGMPPPGTPLKATAVKAAMRRLDPAWDERFDGFGSFAEFIEAHQDVVCMGQTGEATEIFLAERGTLAESNLQRMVEFAQSPEGPSSESTSVPKDEIVAAIRRALRILGTAAGDASTPQRIPVRGAQLRTQLCHELGTFEESQYGFTSFLDFVLSLSDVVRIARPDSRGDVLVAERASPADASLAAFPEATAGAVCGAWTQTPSQRYLAALRIRRIRHVPMDERYNIICNLVRVFAEARSSQEELSLKDAKDRLHGWYERECPSGSWDSVNNVVYHLFWTYCFEFGEAADDVPLWDRPTHFSAGMASEEEVVRRCDTGLVRMISEVVGTVDPQVVLEVLGDSTPERLPYFDEICGLVNQRLPAGSR